MKKKMGMVIAVMFLMVCFPVSGFSSIIYDKEFEATGFYINYINFGSVSEGSYLLTLEDAGEEPGFQGLVFLFNTGTDNLFDNILFLNHDQTNDSLSFDLEGGSTLSAMIFGLTNLNTGLSSTNGSSVPPSLFATSSFEVQLTSVPLPATLLLLGSGLVALTALKRRRQ